MTWVAVRDWQRHQHYKDRAPPWIKLHVALLNDRAFMALAPASRCLLMLLWVLASEKEGLVLYDEEELRFRLRWPTLKLKDMKPLFDAGFLLYPLAPASTTLAPASTLQADACLETETEVETETETDKINATSRKRSSHRPTAAPFTLPDWIPEPEWIAWLEMRQRRRNPPTDRAKDLAVRALEKLRAQGEDPAEVLNQSTFRGWQGLFAVKPDGSDRSENVGNPLAAFFPSSKPGRR